jgi:hypothetical protein
LLIPTAQYPGHHAHHLFHLPIDSQLIAPALLSGRSSLSQRLQRWAVFFNELINLSGKSFIYYHSKWPLNGRDNNLGGRSTGGLSILKFKAMAKLGLWLPNPAVSEY